MSDYEVIFYTASSGRSPVQETLAEYEASQRSKILRQLKYLKEFGPTPAIPNTKKIQGTDLWELRILGEDNIRIFYAPLDNKKVAVLHIFTKKKQKTSRKEIKTAETRYRRLT